MIDIVIFFLIFHFLADFYFQNAELAIKKNNQFKYLLVHCLIYGLVLAVPVFFSFDFATALLMLGIVIVSHFTIDHLRIMLNKKYNNNKFHYYSFIVDQILHLIVIFIVASYANYYIDNAGYIEYHLLRLDIFVTFEQITKVIFAIVFVLLPSSVFIKHTFNCLYIQKEEVDLCIEDKELNAGKIIGYLERLIIVLLGMMGLYTSIALVLTAKSIARFKTINDDPGFAEKYLIGTLLSLFLAIICLVIIKL